MEVCGTEGTIRLPHWNHYEAEFDLYRHGPEGGTWQAVTTERPYAAGSWRGLGVADMAAALLSGRPHRASGERANHVLEIMAGLVRSAETGAPIPITTPTPSPTHSPPTSPRWTTSRKLKTEQPPPPQHPEPGHHPTVNQTVDNKPVENEERRACSR